MQGLQTLAQQSRARSRLKKKHVPDLENRNDLTYTSLSEIGTEQRVGSVTEPVSTGQFFPKQLQRLKDFKCPEKIKKVGIEWLAAVQAKKIE